MRAPIGWLGPGRLIEDVVVVIDRGRVTFAGAAEDLGVVASHGNGVESLSGRPIPPEADEEIHVEGFLLPGVVDRHVHIALAAPAAVLAGGVTAVRDLGWPPEDVLPLAQASESLSFDGPLIRAVGPMITCRGGYPTGSGWAPQGTGLEVSGPEEAAAAVARTLEDSGVGVVKVALNADAGPTLRDDELVAVCDAAHARRAIVTAHAQGAGQVERALGAGVDELAHAPWSEELSDDLIQSLARRMRIVSTLDIHSYGRDTPQLRVATGNLRRFLAAGGTVVYGTDLGNGPIPVGIHPGEAWHLHRAGMPVGEVLRAMTFRPLAPGEPGDVVVLGADPLHDLTALADVRLVLREGRRIS